MRDYLSLETTPSDEPCVQIGHDLYRPIASMEAHLMQQQLEELLTLKFSDIIINLTISQCFHDFGTYYEIRAYYDRDNERQVEQAFFLDDNYPKEWSPDKKKTLLDYCSNKGFSYS
jgi:hypothetical protein